MPRHSRKAGARSVAVGVRARGFTLLEVMVSLGILAVALLAIGGINSGAVRMHAYSKQLTVATQLARGKMLDLQTQLRKDGLGDFSKEYSGDFSEEKAPGFTWKAQVIKPEMELDTTQLLEMVGGMFGLGGETSGGPELVAANPLTGGPMAGMIDGQAKAMVEAIKSSLREIKLTVEWKTGNQVESFDLVEHVIVLPDAKASATANAQPTAPGADGQGGPLGSQPLNTGGVPGPGGGVQQYVPGGPSVPPTHYTNPGGIK